MKYVGYFFLLLIALFLLSLLSRGCHWFYKATDVVEQQIDPSTMLKKYEWFKDAAAQLDARRANLVSYDTAFAQMKRDYGTERSKWSREDAENYNLRESEYMGIKQAYNTLAAEYNANMAKINYRFCNVGTLPQGTSEVLPRQYREYL